MCPYANRRTQENQPQLTFWTAPSSALTSHHDTSAFQGLHYSIGRNRYCFSYLSTFRYLRDPLFLSSCLLYTLNRWVIKPQMPHSFFAWWFNDLFLIPCAAPLCLWIERRLGVRKHDKPPTAGEIAFYLLFWSVLFEIIAPHFIPYATGDWHDALAYAIGGLVAWAWWNRSGIVQRLQR